MSTDSAASMRQNCYGPSPPHPLIISPRFILGLPLARTLSSPLKVSKSLALSSQVIVSRAIVLPLQVMAFIELREYKIHPGQMEACEPPAPVLRLCLLCCSLKSCRQGSSFSMKRLCRTTCQPAPHPHASRTLDEQQPDFKVCLKMKVSTQQTWRHCARVF